MTVWLLRKCRECKKYTLNQISCPYCGGRVQIPHPARFSPEDKYVKYKRREEVQIKHEENDNC